MQPIYQRAFPEVGNRAEELLKDTSLPVPFIASTEGMKRDGFDLRADEWDLTRYQNYPVVLYGHDIIGHTSLPIGVGRNARVEDGKLKMDVAYDEDDDFAMKCRSKAIKGMMAGSVSWDVEKNGDKKRNVLIEFSNVNVGLDPDALPELELARVRSMIGEPQYKDLIDQIRADVVKTIQPDEEEEEGDGATGTYYVQVGEIRYDPEQVTITTTSTGDRTDNSTDTFWYVQDGRLLPQPDPEPVLTEETLRRVIQEELEENQRQAPLAVAISSDVETFLQKRAITLNLIYNKLDDKIFNEQSGRYEGYVEDYIIDDGSFFAVINTNGRLSRVEILIDENDTISLGSEVPVKKTYSVIGGREEDNVNTRVETQDDPDKLEQGEGGEPDLWENALDQIHLALEDKVEVKNV